MNEVARTKTFLCTLAAALCWVAPRGKPVIGSEPSIYSLRIASQPLDSALQEFARQSGVQVIFFSRLTEHRRSAALDGRYTIESAMDLLLSQTQLTYHMINAKTLQIEALPPERPRAGAPDARRSENP